MERAGFFRHAVWCVLFATGYLAANRLGLLLQSGFAGLTPLWPAAGIGVALIWLHGPRWWPVIVLGELLTALVLLDQPWYLGLGGGALQVAEAFLAVALLRGLSVDPGLDAPRHVTRFATLGVFIPPLISASGGATMHLAAGLVSPAQWFATAQVWWLGDALGILIITPVIALAPRWRELDREQLITLLTLLGLLLATGVTIGLLGMGRSSLLFFLLLPFVVWAALRCGALGAAATAFALALLVPGLRMLNPDGGAFLDAVHVAFVGATAFTGLLVAAVGAAERRSLEALRWRASHDALTGLMNRPTLEEELSARLTRLGPDGRIALLYLDLDQFKLINDTCGHEVGDRLLAELAGRLRQVVPEERALARLGGDEFAILLDGTEDEAQTRAEIICAELTEYRFQVGELSFGTGASIGLTFCAAQDTPMAALARADLACSVAKQQGRNRVHVYRTDDAEMTRHHGELQWVSQLRTALAEGRFELYAQRVVRIGDRAGEPGLHEVLLRVHEAGRVVGPAASLLVAQRYGLMATIDHWVLERVFQHLARRADAGLSLSVNLSGSTLEQPGFPAFLESLERLHGVAPSRLCLEVTESVAVDRLERAVKHMHTLRARGYRFALDDFGSGVASFGFLQQLPVDVVKIDGRFVRDLGQDPANALIIETLARLARLRGIECVAEWVESREVLEQLGGLGVTWAQGYYIERPQPLADSV
jgi:diguanylate cyclase (GGDEF)-like protein